MSDRNAFDCDRRSALRLIASHESHVWAESDLKKDSVCRDIHSVPPLPEPSLTAEVCLDRNYK